MQLMEANCRPQTKYWTTSNTWPSKEWLAVEEEIAFITLMLSPSMRLWLTLRNQHQWRTLEHSCKLKLKLLHCYLHKALWQTLLPSAHLPHCELLHQSQSISGPKKWQHQNSVYKLMEGEVTKNPCLVLWLGLTDGPGILCIHPSNPLLFYSATSGP